MRGGPAVFLRILFSSETSGNAGGSRGCLPRIFVSLLSCEFRPDSVGGSDAIGHAGKESSTMREALQFCLLSQKRLLNFFKEAVTILEKIDQR